MAKAVLIQNPTSIYKDRPGEAYHFPRRYLGTLRKTVGDWVVFYEGRRGAFGYVAVQKVLDVVPDNDLKDHFFAVFDLASLWTFERTIPRSGPSGRAFETSLRNSDGRPMSGGANTSAVRSLSEIDFAAIVKYGLSPAHESQNFPRAGELPDGTTGHLDGFGETSDAFEHAPLAEFRPEILTSRKFRDASFARQVKAAYGARCAISGLSLRNGGGRPEVEAAHIRPVKYDGPDSVRNGIALSGTLHWMFDRGLISIAEDLRILVSHNNVPDEAARRLIAPGQVLLVPSDPRLRPHPEYLRFHREEIFGQAA
ncbi:MAG: HNH endonuclease [Paracoccaceae bacterium]